MTGDNTTALVIVAVATGSLAVMAALVAGLAAWLNSRSSEAAQDRRSYVKDLRDDLATARARIHELELLVRQLGGTP